MGLRAVWVGHSSVILDVDGHRVLTDPIWSERCSPFQWVGPHRFHPPPLPLAELGRVDAVVISHDHDWNEPPERLIRAAAGPDRVRASAAGRRRRRAEPSAGHEVVVTVRY